MTNAAAEKAQGDDARARGPGGYSELLTQGQILEGQLAVAAKEEGEKLKQVE